LKIIPYLFFFKILIVHVFVSTSTKSSSSKSLVATFVPMIQGIFSSRETIAAWHNKPHSSVTMALALRIAGINNGLVCPATKI
jgi:hypothetical protein